MLLCKGYADAKSENVIAVNKSHLELYEGPEDACTYTYIYVYY